MRHAPEHCLPPRDRARPASRAAAAWRVALVLAAVAAATAGHGCEPRGGGEASPARRPSIVLVSLDTTRSDHMSAYGYPRDTTPRIAELLPASVRFETAYAPMATTLPSHASMFTGLHPRTHGVVKNGLVLADGVPTLARTLAAAGYRTAGFVSSYVLDARFGAHQGFAVWDDDFGEVPCKMLGKRWEGKPLDESFCRRGAETRERAVAWLEASGGLQHAADAPFFLFVHLFDPHDPYVPPPEHAALLPPLGESPSRVDRQKAAYDGEIHYADAQVGHLLDRLAQAGILDDTLVVITGDHGEGLMDHGWMHHGLMIYDEAVRVPWIVRWPARLAGGRSIVEPVELVDVPATILDLAGIDPGPLRGEGRSQAAVLRGAAKPEPERPVFVQRRHYDGRVRDVEAHGLKAGVRIGRWKYIEAKEEGTRELYDLATDPGELANLVDERRHEAARLASVLDAWVAKTPEAKRGSVSDEDAEKLRALGYVQ